MVASILQSLGVNLGPDTEMVPANQFNEAGYFENARSVAANDAFLKKNDLSWRTLPAIESRSVLLGTDEYAAAISEIVKGLNRQSPWCLKDPRLSFLLPYWMEAAKPVSAIICLRRPDAAALSLKTRNDLSVSYSAALWELYTLAALRNTRTTPRAVVVYEQLLANPQQAIETLIASLPELADLNPGADAIKAAVSRVRRDLDHSKPVSSKAMPPAALELYERIAAGDLTITDEDTQRGVAFELVRLEAGHQAAKRLNNEAREQLALVSEQLAAQKTAFVRLADGIGDVVAQVASPGESLPKHPDALLERLRQVVRDTPGSGQKSALGEPTRELARAREDRVEWWRRNSGQAGVLAQPLPDQTASLEGEMVRLRAGQQQHGLMASTNHREIFRLAAEIQRLDELRGGAEESRASLQAERGRLKSEYAIILSRLAAERGVVADTMESLRLRLEQKEALVARMQAEKLGDQTAAAALKRIAAERESLLADLARATQTLGQRNRELTELGVRERELTQLSLELDIEIERLQRELQHARLREAELASTLILRDHFEGMLRAATAQQNAASSEMQQQLQSAHAKIEKLEASLAERTAFAAELETQYVAVRSRFDQYDARMPALEAAAAERDQLAIRNSELKLEISRIIAEREKALEKSRSVVATLEVEVAELAQRESRLAAEAQKTTSERDHLSTRNSELKAEVARIVSERDKTLEKNRNAMAALESQIADLKRSALETEAALTRKVADNGRTQAFEQQISELKSQLAELQTDYAASHAETASVMREAAELRTALKAAKAETAQGPAGAGDEAKAEASTRLDEARREVAELREQLAQARAQSSAATDDESRHKLEHAELERALQSARDRAEALQAELTSKAAAAPTASKPSASDQRLRRQLLVLNELLQAIDTLLSPKYGRFTIPVRQIRVRLTQARQVVDGEVAMTRR